MGLIKRDTRNEFFELFRVSGDIANRAAMALQQAMASDDVDLEELAMIKKIEHEGDKHMHEALSILEKAFITPMDTDKMMAILRRIETLTDSIDQISQHLYMTQVKKPDEYLKIFVKYLVEATGQIVKLTDGLENFKKRPGPLKNCIVEINRIEDLGDQAYQTAMFNLFSGNIEILDVVRFKTLYNQMEDALDCCEDVADIIESVIISET